MKTSFAALVLQRWDKKSKILGYSFVCIMGVGRSYRIIGRRPVKVKSINNQLVSWRIIEWMLVKSQFQHHTSRKCNGGL